MRAGGYGTKYVTNRQEKAEKAEGGSLNLQKIGRGERILNLRPPGPELGGAEPISLVLNHLSGASTVSLLVRSRHSGMNVSPRMAVPTKGSSGH